MQGHFDKSIFRRPRRDPKKWLLFAVLAGYLVGVLFYVMEPAWLVQAQPEHLSAFFAQQQSQSINTSAEKLSVKPAVSDSQNDAQDAVHASIGEISRIFAGIAKRTIVPWQWNSAGVQSSGSFTYTEKNKGVETQSLCSHYKYGSSMYQNCRKAAHKYFQERCSNQVAAACRASEMLP
jgi:hypothetical protein